MSNMKKNSALIYEGTYQAINYIPDADAQLEAYRGIIEYGLYGTEPHSENPFVNMVYVQAIPYLNKARERYQKAVESGKKGGRPTQIDKERVQELKENGLSLKEIAAELGVPENTVKSILYREGAKGAKGMQRGANLNDNVNDNVNVNVNENELEESKNNLFDSFEKEFARPLTPIEFQLINDLESRYGESLVSAALSESIRNGKRSIRYIEAILTNWNAAGVRTVEEAHEMIKNFNLKKGTEKNKLPDWYTDPDDKTTPASKDDVEELKKILDEMG